MSINHYPKRRLPRWGGFGHSLCLRLLFLICAFSAFAVKAQTSVSGVVVDESGEPMIGVSVLEKGTSNATATNVDGEFHLKVSSLNAMLDFSYIGYTSVSQKASAHMKVAMKSSALQLEDVVVVAYGTQKKVTVTGAVNSVDNKEIKKSSAPNLSAALSGKLPGLTTIQTNGEPGRDDVVMYLRGAATTNGTSPLVLVDGVPRESIREIDANEIANVTVLKDASATAVFGVRGANGVILITTRRGEKGKLTVHPSVQYSMQTFARKRQRVDSWDYARLLNESRANAGIDPTFSEEEIAKFDTWRDGTGPSDPNDRYWYPNTNWEDILFKDYASMVRANVDVSGGSEKLQFFVNAGYLYQGGMYNTESKKQLGYSPQSTLNRYNFRSNIDYQFSKYVKASVNLASSIEKVNGTNGSREIIYADGLTASPASPGPTTSGDYYVQVGSEFRKARPGMVVKDPTEPTQSAYGNLNRKGYTLQTNTGINLDANLNVDLSFITPGLSAKGLVAFQSRSNTSMSGNRSFVSYGYSRIPIDEMPEPYYTFDGDDDEDSPLSMSRGFNNGWFVNVQAQVNYARTFNKKHYVTGMALAQRDVQDRQTGGSEPYPGLKHNMIGFSGRATYAFDSRYLAEVNVGYNGSEQFAPDNRFGFFPAFSAGWVASNEKFLINNTVLTNLKFRASYGKVGNDQIGSERFLYLGDTKKTGSGYWEYNIPSLGNGAKISENKIGNPNIQWETAWKQNYGVDISLFKDLSMSFDYFIEKREDILIQRQMVPYLNGLPLSSLPKVNMGKVDNQGYEITLNYHRTIGKDLQLNVGGNFAYNKNKVIYYDEPMLSEGYAYRYRTTGYSLGQNFGYIIDYSKDASRGLDGSGIFNTQEAIDAYGVKYSVGSGPRPGDFIYKDLNGDKIIDEKDQAPIGNSGRLPRITYGFNVGATWRGFDVSVLFQGVGQTWQRYAGKGIDEGVGSKSYTDMHLNRWTQERFEAGEKITFPRLANAADDFNHHPNSFFVMDRSYLRLKNVEIGYTLPENISKKFGASGFRVYISGDNLYTWDKLKTKSVDPEQTSVLTYPMLRTFNFGVSTNF